MTLRRGVLTGRSFYGVLIPSLAQATVLQQQAKVRRRLQSGVKNA
jgi:hypothetical protein